ncbi:hypothetical protein OESDEN_04947 [Oesophagostomum dentatum]|uniref:Uncharacterized protein n=1 Tax=Oesophagostomum dentatum TaxID=61180 RepID=A0A0B1TIA3_OESDE|nr:hypothetical protein OESDEN_04947 [Oesophagostomum dentatum]
MAEAARRRGAAATQNATSNTTASSNSREPGVARLASEERDSTSIGSDRSSASTERSSEGSASNRLGTTSKESSESMDRAGWDRAPPATTTASPTVATASLSLPSGTSANAPVAGIRRKSQVRIRLYFYSFMTVITYHHLSGDFHILVKRELF